MNLHLHLHNLHLHSFNFDHFNIVFWVSFLCIVFYAFLSSHYVEEIAEETAQLI